MSLKKITSYKEDRDLTIEKDESNLTLQLIQGSYSNYHKIAVHNF